jgi:hypothetical protein
MPFFICFSQEETEHIVLPEERCPVCGELIDICTCTNPEPDPEPVPPPYNPDDPEANYHQYKLEIPLSRTNLTIKKSTYTNHIGYVELVQASYNEEIGKTEINDWNPSYGPVACPDVTDLYKDYYKYYNDKLVSNDDIKDEDVESKYKKIYADLDRGLDEDFNAYPYWKLPGLQVEANTGTEPPYSENDFTFNKSISISKTCLNPDDSFEPKSITLNYLSKRKSGDTIYITYVTPWKKGLGDY